MARAADAIGGEDRGEAGAEAQRLLDVSLGILGTAEQNLSAAQFGVSVSQIRSSSKARSGTVTLRCREREASATQELSGFTRT